MSTNDPQQQSMIREAMKAIAERRPGRTKLVYDKTRRTIVAIAENAEVPRALNITADDADMFAVVTLSVQWLRDRWPEILRSRELAMRFSVWDQGDAYTQHDLGPQSAGSVVDGVTTLEGNPSIAARDSLIRVALTKIDLPQTWDASTFLAPDGMAYRARAWRNAGGVDEPLALALVDIQSALATRRSGLMESNALADSSVLCIGLGTGGAHVVIELAKCGVGRFALVDPDRLSAGNVVRHPGGVSQVGRLKVNVMRDLLLEKNPQIDVSVYPIAADEENATAIGQLIGQADVVICATDNRPSKLLINKLCIEANVVAVYGGAFRRAYGGQVLRVRPKKSLCHQCFISAMPDEASDIEISSDAAADAVAYSDRPVAVEPGLSLDVVPIANMLAKLALLELLKDKQSSLNVLHRDFDAPWFLWINRPESGTPYADWPPLSESSDEMTIHRWYGIHIERDSGCSACGDFASAIAAKYGLDVASLGELPSSAASLEDLPTSSTSA